MEISTILKEWEMLPLEIIWVDVMAVAVGRGWIPVSSVVYLFLLYYLLQYYLHSLQQNNLVLLV